MKATTNDSRKPQARKPVTYSTACFQAALTTGKRLLNADGRSRDARRWRDVYESTRAQVDPRYDHICRSLASLVVTREALDARLVAGEDIDPDILIRLASSISRTLTKLGLAQPPPARGSIAQLIAVVKEQHP
jgi:hypothetical protein